jgi:hypothetical protein
MDARKAFFADMHNMLDIVGHLLSAGDVERVRFGIDIARTSPEIQMRVAEQLRVHIKPALEQENFAITEQLINAVIPTTKPLKVDFAKVDAAMTARVRSCLARMLAYSDEICE